MAEADPTISSGRGSDSECTDHYRGSAGPPRLSMKRREISEGTVSAAFSIFSKEPGLGESVLVG